MRIRLRLSNVPITARNLVQHELVGLEAEVCGAENKSQIGIRGRVASETKNLLVIETKNGEKKISKENAKFIFKLPDGKRVRVDGKILARNPEDRIKIKLKRWR